MFGGDEKLDKNDITNMLFASLFVVCFVVYMLVYTGVIGGNDNNNNNNKQSNANAVLAKAKANAVLAKVKANKANVIANNANVIANNANVIANNANVIANNANVSANNAKNDLNNSKNKADNANAVVQFSSLGCYTDKEDRAFGEYHKNITNVYECNKKAKSLNAKLFSMQSGDECWIGSDPDKNYEKYGTTECAPLQNYPNTAGGKWVNHMYATGKGPEIIPYSFLGCYTDKEDRALKTQYEDVNTVLGCSKKAKSLGAKVFGMQNGDQCWIDPDVNVDYARHGKVTCSTRESYPAEGGGRFVNRMYRVN